MDSRSRARGFMKGMMGGFHGEPKGCGSSHRGACKKPKPTAAAMVTSSSSSSSSSSCSSCHVSFMVHQEKVMMAKQNHRVVVQEAVANLHEANFWNPHGVAGDEHIDRKAASYISSVQERFRLEGLA